MEQPGGEWVTVPEAARRLGIDARQVRRYADRLGHSDRTEDRTRTRAGRPVLMVRLAAVAALREGKAPPEPGVVEDIRTGQDKDRTKTGQDDVLLSELRGRLADKDAEIVYLRAALEREQANTAAALQQLRDADTRLAAVLAGTGRLSLPSGEVGATHAPSHSGSEAPQPSGAKPPTGEGVTGHYGGAPIATAPDPGPAEESVAREGRDGSTGRTEGRGVSWWARLWGRT